MQVRKKPPRRYYRLAGWLLVISWLICFPAVAGAADTAQVSLEQAIRTVKANFTIPATYANLETSYHHNNDRQIWSLNWRSPDGNQGYFQAEVDAETGEIIQMNIWQPADQPAKTPPAAIRSKAEARQTATRMLNRLAPARVAELVPIPDDSQLVPLTRNQHTYTFRWQRAAGGVPFAQDGVQIDVRSDNNAVIRYVLNWTKTTLPPATGTINPEIARQGFNAAGMLEARYILPSTGRQNPGGKLRPQLVYQLDHPSQGYIDARTGKPLDLGSDVWFDGIGGMGGAEAMATVNDKRAADPMPPLSPEELREIEQTAKLLPQEAAIKAVKKWVTIPANLELRYATLNPEWGSPDIRAWNFSWQRPGLKTTPPEPNLPEYIHARVNAVTGEVIEFSLSYPSDPQKPGKITATLDREAAQRLVEDFLRQIQPQRFPQTTLAKDPDFDRPLPTGEDELPIRQNFNYQRLVDGILFPANGIRVTVDAVSGRITSYSLQWFNLEFPAPAGMLTPEQAVDRFLDYRPLTLSYIQVRDKIAPTGKVYLVYQPVKRPDTRTSNQIDAFSGQPLDYRGNPLNTMPQARHFTDVTGHWAEKEINLGGQAGLFGEFGDTFQPEETITTISLLRNMLLAGPRFGEQAPLPDQEVLDQARQLGWVTGNPAPDAAVSRETLAILMVRLINLEPAARITGIYQVPFSDAGSLPPETTGYIALAWGLKILHVPGPSFVADQPVTRAEAAYALVRTLMAKR
ncbi:MAG: PepSY domain-containing protein [Heliobacteriaceae bacterium]|nr:PepSY domain-containing protein [Heliobacteriaceae bacterium]